MKLSKIGLFLHHDLDFLEAVRTAPHQSWKNPCERVNCILNLGLQATGLMRMSTQKKLEKIISACNSIQEIRQAIEKTPGLEDALKDCIDPVKSLMHSIFFCLSLKDEPFLSYTAASKHEMDAMFYMILILAFPQRGLPKKASQSF